MGGLAECYSSAADRFIIRVTERARFAIGHYDQPSEDNTVLRIFDLNESPSQPMENGRGETVRLVNTGLGTEKIDVHLNRLVPGGQRGRLHHHSQSDNVYIVRRGEGVLTAGDETYTIRPDQVIYIPAGMAHALSNLSDDVLEILEIYAPAGRQFDFTPVT